MLRSKEPFLISSISLHDFDDDPDFLNFLINNATIIPHNAEYEDIITKKAKIGISNNIQVLADAIYCDDNEYADKIIFVTGNMALADIANLFLGDKMIEIPKYGAYL